MSRRVQFDQYGSEDVLQVISCFRPLGPSEVVLGQFAGYRDVAGVAARSSRDTFVAARLWIDNARWRGVPFYLRTGKRLAATKRRVSLILREPAGPLPREANVLSFSLAGDGEIDLSLVAKRPGPALDIDTVLSSGAPTRSSATLSSASMGVVCAGVTLRPGRVGR
jgi:glucose-6-phosphate 1-dehydrogenase